MRTMAFLAALLLTVGASAQEQIPSFELERLVLNPAGRGGLLLSGGELLGQGGFTVAAAAHYQHEPLVFLDLEGRVLAAAVSNRTTVHLMGAYGILPWLEAGLQVPVIVHQRSGNDFTSLGFNAVQSFALGTPWLQLRGRIFEERSDDALDLALRGSLGLPIGSDRALSRDVGVSGTVHVEAGKKVAENLRLVGEVGSVLRPTRVISQEGQPRDEVGTAIEVSAGVTTLGDKLRYELALRSAIPLVASSPAGEVLGGIRAVLGDWELFGLLGPGIGRAPGTPLFRVLIGGALLPEKTAAVVNPDRDLDGVLDADDRCVDVAGPVELQGCPDRDGDGVLDSGDRCPDIKGRAEHQGCPDADGDGLVDGDDACPTEAGPRERKGCPPKDTDSDGLMDDEDACPSEPGTVERKGCPPRDTDKDGVLDEVDACPNEPGEARLKGCPIRDTDGDGVIDGVDECPEVAGAVTFKGCPIPDTDGDGVLDDVDSCKSEPGPVENSGCPVESKPLVVITRERLVIKDSVYFDTGKATIQARSFPLLDQVAKILREHPEVERLMIEGHTDSVGKPQTNRVLSQKRAESVRDYFIQKGVEPQRLEAKGFGPDRPIATNKTKAGRELNRRVDFIIAPPATTP